MASLRKQPSGVWRARYRDDAGREHARHYARKVDAQQWLDEVTAAQVTGQYVDPRAGRVTVAQFFERWSADQVWKPGTQRAKAVAMGSLTFGDVPVAQVRRSHVQAWVKQLTANGLAASTVHARYAVLRGVMRAAVADRVIASDPSAGVSLPALGRDRMLLPTDAQVADLLHHAGDWSPAIGLAAFAGLRSGEVAGVQVGDVDFLRGILHVRRQVQWVKGEPPSVDPPKYGSLRDVFLPTGLGELLAGHIAAHRAGDDPTRWLLADGPMSGSQMGSRWNATAAAAKIPRIEVEGKRGRWAITLHDLRHYYASGLIASGCDVVTVQRALGHEKATTTLNTYAHLWHSAEDRTRAAAGAMLAAVQAAADSVRTADSATSP